jgi:hypothetical protein
MSARNIYHDAVVAALKADGWTISDDPLRVMLGRRRLYIDLAAERPVLGAEKNGERIAVEVQSFLGDSDVENLQHAIGQYSMYRVLLEQMDPTRRLYLAVSDEVYSGILGEPLGQLVTSALNLKVIVVDTVTQRILKWIS